MAVIAVGGEAGAAPHRVGLSAHRRSSDGVIFTLLGTALVGVVCSSLLVGGLWKLHAVNPPLRSAVETAVALCALVSAVLLGANFRQTRLLRDLLLLAGMVTAGVTTFVFNTLPTYTAVTSIYGAGARTALMILVTILFVAIAFVPPEQSVGRGRRPGALVLSAGLGWVALGEAVDLIAGPVHRGGPAGDFRGIAHVLVLVSACGLLVSVYGFVGRPRRGSAEVRLLAAAATTLAMAQVGRLTLAVVPQAWVSPSEGLRTATYLLLLVVSVRTYRASQAQRARAALDGERQRIARDLHDGLAQDLAFIASHSDRLAHEYGMDHPLAIAAQRALAVSRAQIVDLEASSASDTAGALREVARELARRFGVQINVEVERGACAHHNASDRSQLVRIAREAIANAIRHGGAQSITVTMGARHTDGLLLRVSDDGRGFADAVAETAGTGLGMQTMRDRAGQLGARLTTRRSDSGHTELDVRTVSTGRRRVTWRRR